MFTLHAASYATSVPSFQLQGLLLKSTDSKVVVNRRQSLKRIIEDAVSVCFSCVLYAMPCGRSLMCISWLPRKYARCNVVALRNGNGERFYTGQGQ